MKTINIVKTASNDNSKPTKAKRGYKTCPFCSSVVPARAMVCPCSFKFPQKNKRWSARNANNKAKNNGYKTCPNCFEVVSKGLRVCPCGYVFSYGGSTQEQKKACQSRISEVGFGSTKAELRNLIKWGYAHNKPAFRASLAYVLSIEGFAEKI